MNNIFLTSMDNVLFVRGENKFVYIEKHFKLFYSVVVMKMMSQNKGN